MDLVLRSEIVYIFHTSHTKRFNWQKQHLQAYLKNHVKCEMAGNHVFPDYFRLGFFKTDTLQLLPNLFLIIYEQFELFKQENCSRKVIWDYLGTCV